MEIEKSEMSRRRSLSHYEAMIDAEAMCVPCKLCGGKARITDAGTGWGYYIRCENAQRVRPSRGCIITESRLGGWAYNVMEWWNRLHFQPSSSGLTRGSTDTLTPQAHVWGEAKAEDCVLSIGSERVCAHGTLGCVNHHAPQTRLKRARIATVEDHNAAFDPADEALGGAFKAGFKEGWIYAEIDADGDRYQEIAEEYGLAVDTAPQECWDAHREKFFAMLPLAAIPEVGTSIGDVEGEIARVVQSVKEWDDRTSPDDYPEHLLITSEELADILRNFADALAREGKDNV